CRISGRSLSRGRTRIATPSAAAPGPTGARGSAPSCWASAPSHLSIYVEFAERASRSVGCARTEGDHEIDPGSRTARDGRRAGAEERSGDGHLEPERGEVEVRQRTGAKEHDRDHRGIG